jgi:hypothetical protein
MAVVVVGLGVAALIVLSPLDVVSGAWTAPLSLAAGALGAAGLAERWAAVVWATSRAF